MYAHLENILVHMINTQDVAIFKSQKDYIRNKQKLSEYIYAMHKHVKSCRPYSTLIVFFIRYQKTM